MWTDSYESVARRGAERFDGVAGAVGKLDLHVRLLDTSFLGELLNPAVNAVDEVVQRPCEAWNPEAGHGSEERVHAGCLTGGDVREAELGDHTAARGALDETEL